MAANISAPRFRRGQIACFIGGQGMIKQYQPESGSWSYLIEMEMGPEPEMGRLGSETMVCLLENDLTVLM